MKAIILAAGRGSRMKNLTDNLPKCLVPLKGKPLLEWQLDAIYNAGIKDVGIVTGYKRELLSRYGLTEFNNEAWSLSNMVSSLLKADAWLKNDTCIVSYSDIFYQSDAVSSLIECSTDIAITYDINWQTMWEKRFGNPLLDAETFRINQNKELIEIGNKPNQVSDIQGQYMGLLKFTPDGWRMVKEFLSTLNLDEIAKIHMTGLLQQIIDRKIIPIQATPYSGIWGEVDTESDLIIYQ